MIFSFFLVFFPFKDFPIVVKIVWVLAIVFFVFFLIAVFYLKILRERIRIREAYIVKQQKKYEELVITYLYANEENLEINKEQRQIIDEIKDSLIRKRNRFIFTETLLKFKGEVSGAMVDSVRKMYREVGLLERAKTKLQHKEWHIVATGIRDYRKFGIKEGKEEINEFINHEKGEVRREAYLYFLELFGFEGLSFLDNLKESISRWDEVGIFSALSKFKNQNPPGLSKITKWLKSENDCVVAFTLNFVKIYNLVDAKDEAIKLLSHEIKIIRYKAIVFLNHFYVFEAKPLLIEKFEYFTEKEQIAVFNYLENMYSTEDESFVLKHVNNPIFEIKVIAIKILQKINIKSFLKLKTSLKDDLSIKIINYTENNL